MLCNNAKFPPILFLVTFEHFSGLASRVKCVIFRDIMYYIVWLTTRVSILANIDGAVENVLKNSPSKSGVERRSSSELLNDLCCDKYGPPMRLCVLASIVVGFAGVPSI